MEEGLSGTDIRLDVPLVREKNKKVLGEKKKRIVALKPSQVINKKRIVYEFEGKWLASFGRPEWVAKWFITGPPYSGKSSLLFELSAMLCELGKLDYVSYEEGNTQTVADKIKKHGLDGHEANFRLLPKVELEDFKNRLLGKRSAVFAVIDSVQHAQINKKQYSMFTNAVCNPRRGKSLLFVCHGSKTDLNLFIKHDCDIKIEVIGFVAHVESRFGGNKPFVIWEEKAKEYWGKKYKQVIEGKYWPGQKK